MRGTLLDLRSTVKRCVLSRYTFAAAAMLAVVGMPGIAAAQAESIPLHAIDLDWATFATTLAGYLTAVIATAVGIGAGIWMVRLVYRMFKGFARG